MQYSKSLLLIFTCTKKIVTALHIWRKKPPYTNHTLKLSRPSPGRGEKINLNSYFHTCLRCLKKLYEGLKSFHKTFWGTTKKCENSDLCRIKILLVQMTILPNDMHGPFFSLINEFDNFWGGYNYLIKDLGMT